LRKRRAVLAAVPALAAAVALAGCGGGGSAAGGRVVVALDFTPNPAHAPIFLAARQRFDRHRGVRIAIRKPGPGPDTLKLLAAGRADIGVLDINDLGLARERGEDLVGARAATAGGAHRATFDPPPARP
jgi:putative hydroxymethylpyrimidine transport system substrate-binding protein